MKTSLESIIESILTEALTSPNSSGPAATIGNGPGGKMIQSVPSGGAAFSHPATQEDNQTPELNKDESEDEETLRKTVTKIAKAQPERSDATQASMVLNDPKSTLEQKQQKSYELLVGEINRLAQENPKLQSAQTAARIFQDPNATSDAKAKAVVDLQSELGSSQSVPDPEHTPVEEAVSFYVGSIVEELIAQYSAELELMTEAFDGEETEDDTQWKNELLSGIASSKLDNTPSMSNDDSSSPVPAGDRTWTEKQSSVYNRKLKRLKRDIGGDLLELRSDLNALGYRSDLSKNKEVTNIISALRELTSINVDIEERAGWLRRQGYSIGGAAGLLGTLAAGAGLIAGGAASSVATGIGAATAVAAGLRPATRAIRDWTTNPTPSDTGYTTVGKNTLRQRISQ